MSDLRQILNGLMTDRTEPGRYDWRDYNRVEEAVEAIAAALESAGNAVSVSVKTDWTRRDIQSREDLRRYLNNVEVIRAVLTPPPGTPGTPTTMNRLHWETANNIERILLEIGKLTENMAATIDQGWALGTSHTGLYAARSTAHLLAESGALIVEEDGESPDLLKLPDAPEQATVELLAEYNGTTYRFEVEL